MGFTDNKVNISVCMGSSCFARGNKELAQELKDFIDSEDNCEDKAMLSGNLCDGRCESGPNIKINGKIIKNTEEHILEKIKKQLKT